MVNEQPENPHHDGIVPFTPSEETTQPVRPGVPGGQPFWNAYSSMGFMVAPAFDFGQIAGATAYRFTIVPKDGGAVLSFCAKTPWASLSPVWKRVPVGFVTLTVEGLDDNRVIGVSGTCHFYRKAPFHAPDPAAVHGYRECGEQALRHLYGSSHVTYWLDHDAPDPTYGYYCYPSKIIGAVLRGLTRYSRIDPETRNTALMMARNAADYLIRVSTSPNAVFSCLPPTYQGEHAAARGQNDIVMMTEPAWVARGYLDLYDTTKIQRYFDAAERIATTYAKTQRDTGTWYLRVKPETGDVVSRNAVIPIGVIQLFQRLNQEYGCTAFCENNRRAMNWIIANPVKTFNWEGQFEDVGPSEPYRNLAKDHACSIAVHMLDNADENPEYIAWALEIIRFAEDQFVIWRQPNPDLKPENWLIPCALEQYAWMKPINASASDLIRAWAAAYRHTGQEIFRQKARALADVMTVSQHLSDGELPTYWIENYHDNWLNCAVYSALTMIGLESSGIYAVLPETG